MASTSAVSMAIMPLTNKPTTNMFFNPLTIKVSSSKTLLAAPCKRMVVRSSLKEKAVTAMTAAALTASMVVPDVAQAAASGVTPSLNNFLLSIGAGGVVLAGILGAIIGVSNFDPVKRDLMRRLMEGEAYQLMGNAGIQFDGKTMQMFQKSFVQVQNLLDHNRVLINEINQNHESKVPDNLSRNVGLIRELNNNIRRVVHLYSDLSSNLSKDSEGDSRLDAKALHKRIRPA
ncbi:protein ELF4-LIKE 3 [Tanacetum coccineum]